MRLVTWEMAIGHLKLTVPESSPQMTALEADIRHKIEVAEELVLDHVNQRIGDTAEEWADDVALWNVAGGSPSLPVPARVQAAVLIQLAELHRFRGDDHDDDMPERGMGELHPRAVSYLYRLRDPAIA